MAVLAMYSRALEKPADMVVGAMKLEPLMVYVEDILVIVVFVVLAEYCPLSYRRRLLEGSSSVARVPFHRMTVLGDS
jgi:Na+/H+ antiporter NhaA